MLFTLDWNSLADLRTSWHWLQMTAVIVIARLCVAAYARIKLRSL